jgi:1-acyl-sn-glycerol-3-phosphate acyltransferase
VVLNRKARYPAAKGVMTAFGGWVGWLFGRWGVFSVDLDNGAAALKASVNVMEAGEIEVIFPEAWTNMDGVVGKMKTGTVRIAKAAAEKLGKPVYIIPGYMRYHKYPGKWILKLPIPLQWAVPLLGALYYGRGATVVIGEPISSDELPADHHEATEYLRQRIIALDPGPGCG